MKQVAITEQELKSFLSYLSDKIEKTSKKEVEQKIEQFLNEQVIHFQGQILK